MTKILLVEDDKSLREIYGVRLLAEGYDIVSAGDGEEALAMAIKDRPDLIVSDVMMPKISGFDMLDILRSTTETKGIKVIMMTALSSEEQRQRGVALGADRYLVKSQVGIEDVVRAVHEVLADAPAATVAPQPQASTLAAPAAPTPPATQAATPTVPPTPPVPTVAPAVPSASATPPLSSTMPSPLTPPSAAPAPASPSPLPPATPLPSPTAPLTPPPATSTAQKQTLASRVIEPLPSASQTGPDFGNLINRELSQTQNPAPAVPSVSATPPSNLQFEETPLPPQPPAPTAPASSIGVEPTPNS